MNKEDFKKLTIDTVIYFKGKEKRVSVLYHMWSIEFLGDIGAYKWEEICQDCSLAPPKEEWEIAWYDYHIKDWGDTTPEYNIFKAGWDARDARGE